MTLAVSLLPNEPEQFGSIKLQGDTTNPRNPIPFCNQATYFNSPTITLPGFENPPLSYITIDHLPSLLPRVSIHSVSDFSIQVIVAGDFLLPHLVLGFVLLARQQNNNTRNQEASEAFSTALLPSLLELKDRTAPVWQGAEDLFKRKVSELNQAKNFVTGSTIPVPRP